MYFLATGMTIAILLPEYLKDSELIGDSLCVYIYGVRLTMKGTFSPLLCFPCAGVFPQLLALRHVQEDDRAETSGVSH